MPLTGTGNTLGDDITTAINAKYPTLTPAQVAQMKDSWETIASVIVAHITANAAVSTSVTGSAAVTTAPGTAPVTGTGTGGVS